MSSEVNFDVGSDFLTDTTGVGLGGNSLIDSD